MSLLGLVRCRGSRTFSASSGLRMPFSITSCLTVFPVSPASFAISAAFSYPMIGFSFVAIAGLDSAYRWSTSTFAVIPSMHLCAKTRATFARSSTFCWIRCDITGIIVERSRFEWVFATAIARSLPMTVTPTCMTVSGITGLTFPGMMEEPGWTAGRFRARGSRGGHPANPVIDLGLIPGELLAQSDRSRIHQMGPSGLDDRIEILRLPRETIFQLAQGRKQTLVEFQQGGDVDRRRDDVVRGLAHVHMVVRMDGAFLTERMTQDLVRAVRDHLVRVHVGRGPAPGLEDIEGDLCVQFPVHNFLAGLDRRLANLAVE